MTTESGNPWEPTGKVLTQWTSKRSCAEAGFEGFCSEPVLLLFGLFHCCKFVSHSGEFIALTQKHVFKNCVWWCFKYPFSECAK